MQSVGLIGCQLEVVVAIERLVLLLVKWDIGREWSQVPMHMTVGLLAAETQDVQAFARYEIPDHSTDPMDHTLKFNVLLLGEVSGDLLTVLPGRHDHVPIQGGVLAEECHHIVVLVDHTMKVISVPSDEFTDEANAGQPVSHCSVIDSDSFHPAIMAGKSGWNHRMSCSVCHTACLRSGAWRMSSCAMMPG